MEIRTLKSIIEDQRRRLEEKFRKEKIIERENIDHVKKFLKYPNILAILGVRRCGKSIFSYLLSKKFRELVSYINFDDERLVGLKTEDLNKVLQAFYELYGKADFIILDEIQNVKNWELFSTRLRETKKIIITGSNSSLLSGELASRLTGRYIDFTLYPFSFREILDFEPNIYLTEDIARIRKKLEEYIRGSGFPEFRKFGPDIIDRIHADSINKDCIRRYKIRNIESFKELANYLISNFSNEFTYSKLSKLFKIRDVHTIKNYVNYLKEAFLIVVLDRFSQKLKQQVLAPKKVYVVDQGFCNFVSFRLTRDIGRILENIVCIELMRQKSKNYHLKIFYWKDHQQNEVDFIIKEKLRVKQLIQVCYDVSEIKTKERQVKSLLKSSKELRCNNLLVITDDYEATEKHKNKTIKFIPLWKWLLQEDKGKKKAKKNN